MKQFGTYSQWIGTTIILILVGIVIFTMETHPVPEHETKAWKQDSARHYWDSIHHVRDSLRQYYDSVWDERERKRAYWDSVYQHIDSTKEYWKQYYDSVFERRDSIKQYWDSVHLVRDSIRTQDSLQRTKMYPSSLNRDTIIELNTADTTSLQHIFGIGSYTAKCIINYRNKLGGYCYVGQIVEERHLKRMYAKDSHNLDSAMVHLTADTTLIQRLRINHASMEQLIHHPYISYEQAKRIVQSRRDKKPWTEQKILSLPEFSEKDSILLHYYIDWE